VDFAPVEAIEEFVDQDPSVCAEIEPRPFSMLVEEEVLGSMVLWV